MNKFATGIGCGLMTAILATAGCAAEGEDLDKLDSVERLDQNLGSKADRVWLRMIGPIGHNEKQVADLDGARYIGWTIFDVREGDELTVKADGAYDAGLDTVLLLYRADSSGRPTGYLLAYNDDYGDGYNSQLTYTVIEQGNYAAVVRRYDRRRAGAIALTTELTSSIVVCGGFRGASCDPGQYCHYENFANCGRSDGTGECRPIPEFCTDDYTPVCGCDGFEYANSCYAAAAGVAVSPDETCEPAYCGGISYTPCTDASFCDFRDGICGSGDQTGSCTTKPDLCPTNVDPVCGCNGRTYNNRCEANRAGASIDHTGPCGPEA